MAPRSRARRTHAPRALFSRVDARARVVDAFDRDLGSNLIDQKISADMARGSAQGVNGTPTVFLDSHLLKYEATNLDGLRKGINVLLERKAAS